MEIELEQNNRNKSHKGLQVSFKENTQKIREQNKYNMEVEENELPQTEQLENVDKNDKKIDDVIQGAQQDNNNDEVDNHKEMGVEKLESILEQEQNKIKTAENIQICDSEVIGKQKLNKSKKASDTTKQKSQNEIEIAGACEDEEEPQKQAGKMQEEIDARNQSMTEAQESEIKNHEDSDKENQNEEERVQSESKNNKQDDDAEKDEEVEMHDHDQGIKDKASQSEQEEIEENEVQNESQETQEKTRDEIQDSNDQQASNNEQERDETHDTKSLRALVMEKSAKRQTVLSELPSVSTKFPQANSTELPEASMAPNDSEIAVEPNHDVSKRTRQTTLEMYLQKIKKQNMDRKLKMEEAVRNSLKTPSNDILNPFKVPSKPAFSTRKQKVASKPKAKQLKPTPIPLDDLPAEVIEDMKYKPPRRFQPSNASWITKRLYNFLESKLEPKYDYNARVRAEKLVETIYHFSKNLRRVDVASDVAVDALKQEMARLDIVKTHFDFYQFFDDYMPREIRVKVVPDVVNKINVPRHGVFSDIVRGHTVEG